MKQTFFAIGLWVGVYSVVAFGASPEITLTGDAELEVELGANFQDPGATATDAEDGNIDQIVITYFPPGIEPYQIVKEENILAWWKFDDGGGTLASDFTLNGWDGTLSGNEDWVEGKFGGAIDFKGVGNMKVTGTDILAGKTEASYSFWARQDSLSQDQYMIWNANRVLVQFGDSFNIKGAANLRVRWFIGNSFANSHTAEGVLDTEGWHHWGLTFGQKTTRIFKDGVEVYNGTDSNASLSGNTATTWIGKRDGGGTPFQGSVDEFRIYDIELTAEDNVKLYGGGNGDVSVGAVDELDTSVMGLWHALYSVTDSDGNVSTIQRVLNVVDPLAPSLELVGPNEIDHEKGTLFELPEIVAKKHDGTVIDSPQLDVTGEVDVDTDGVYELIVDYTDGDGHKALPVHLQVTVEDTQPPVITLNGGDVLKINLGSEFRDPGGVAVDAGDGEVALASSLWNWNQLAIGGWDGNLSYDLTQVDFNGNGKLMNQVPDAATLLTHGPAGKGVNFENAQDFQDASAGITSGETFRNRITGYFFAQKAGEYEFGIERADDGASFWLDLDQNGVFETSGDEGSEWMNQGTGKGYSTVQLLPGMYKVGFGHMVGSGSSAMQARFRTPEGAGPSELTTVHPTSPEQAFLWATMNPIDTAKAGNYEITYSAIDKSGNLTTKTRHLEIGVFTDIPTIEIQGPTILVHNAGEDFTLPEVKVFDHGGEELDASKLVINGNVDVNQLGEYVLTYHFTNAAGVPATPVEVTVHVRDFEAPTMALVGDASIAHVIGTEFSDPGVTVADNMDTELTVASNALLPMQNLWLHLDANSIKGLEDGGIVLNWRDISGTHNHADNVKGEPSWHKMGINGMPSIHFGGEESLAIRQNLGTSHSILTVSQLEGRKNDRLLSTTGTNWALGYIGGYEDAFYANGWAIPQSKRATNVPHLYTAISTGSGDLRFYAEGEWIEGRTGFNVGINQFQMGAYRNLEADSVGDVAEVIIYDRALSEQERLDVEAYLGVKYGLAGYEQGTPVDLHTPGTYTIVYRVMDDGGNVATIEREVVVSTPGFEVGLVLNGESEVHLEVGTEFVEPGYVLYDNQGSEIPSPPVLVNGTVDKDTPGTYVIRYDPDTGNGGDFTPKVRTVIVADTEAPDLVFPEGEAVRLLKDATYTAPTFTATDAVDGDLSGEVEILYPHLLGLQPGLTADFYILQSQPQDFQDLRALTPDLSRMESEVNFPSVNATPWEGLPDDYVDNFAARFNGYIWIEETGAYGFYLSSDDGSMLKINGETVIDHGGLHGMSEKGTTVLLKQGYHHVDIQYFEAGGGAGLQFFWRVPGGNKEIVPAEVLFNGTPGLDTSLMGSHSVRYSVSDSSGNETSIFYTVIVSEDVTEPFLRWNGLPLEIVEYDPAGTYEDPGVKVFDSNASLVNDKLKGQGSVDLQTLGDYILTYQYTDGDGKSAQPLERTIEVVDTTAPVITLEGDSFVRIQQGMTYEDPGATASDAWDGDLEVRTFFDEIPNTLVHEAHVIDYGYWLYEFDGNRGLLNRTPDAMEFYPGVREDGDLNFNGTDAERIRYHTGLETNSFISVLSGNFHAKRSGVYYFRTASSRYGTMWLDLDQDGVMEVDGEKGKEQLLLGTQTRELYLEKGQYWVVFAYTAYQNSNWSVEFRTPEGAGPENITYVDPSDPVQEGIWSSYIPPIDTTRPGRYSIDYEVVDSFGNVATAQRMVLVEENLDYPVLVLQGDEWIAHELGKEYTDPGVVLMNTKGELLDDTPEVDGLPDGSVVGNFEVTYTFINEEGISAKPMIRTVIVQDTIPPVITLVGNNPQTVYIGTEYKDPGAFAEEGGRIIDAHNTLGLPMEGIHAWWRFNETDGDVAQDVFGNYDGVLNKSVGGEWVADGKLGGALQLNKATTNQYLEIPTYEIGPEFSYSGWFRLEKTSRHYRIIDFGGNNLDNFVIHSKDSSNHEMHFLVREGTDTSDHRINNIASVGNWVHLVFTIDASGRKVIYRNGTQVGSFNGRPLRQVVRDRHRFGASPVGGNHYFGSLDEVMLYHRVITPSEVATIAAGPQSIDVSSEGEHTITYFTQDSSGNASVAERTVIVKEAAGNIPTIELTGETELEMESGTPFEEPGVSIKLQNGQPIAGAEPVITGTVPLNGSGEYRIAYDYLHPQLGAAATVFRTITLVDSIPPVITLKGDNPYEQQLGNRYVDPGYSAEDPEDGQVEVAHSLLTVNAMRAYGYKAGPDTKKYLDLTASNNFGLFSLPPDSIVSEFRGDLYFDQESQFHALFPELSGDKTYHALFTGYLYCEEDSIYEFNVLNYNRYTAFWVDLDGDGEFQEEGSAGPEIVNPAYNGSYSIMALKAGYHEFAVATLNTDGTPNMNVRFRAIKGVGATGWQTINPNAREQDGLWNIRQEIPMHTPGQYQVTYEAVDKAGNVATAIRTITVKNNPNAALMNLIGDAEMTIEQGEAFVDPGVTVETLDGDPLDASEVVITPEDFSTEVQGTVVLHYNYSNAAGIPSRQVTRSLRIIDSTPPEITLIGGEEISWDIGEPWEDPGFLSTDTVDGDLLIYSSENIPTAGLLMHVDASAIKGLEDGDPITVWEDLSGNGNDMADVYGKPMYRESGIGNLPTVFLDGNSTLSSLRTYGSTYSIITVSQLTGAKNDILISSKESYWALGYLGNQENYFRVKNNVYAHSFHSLQTATPHPHIYSATSNGINETKFYGNGQDLTERAWYLNWIGTLQLGAYDRTSDLSAGEVSEIYLYNYSMQRSMLRNVELRMLGKYGIDGTPQITPVDTSRLGTYQVLYKSTDYTGNVSTKIRTVHVVEPEGVPQIVLEGEMEITMEAGETFEEPGYELFDENGDPLDVNLVTVGGDLDEDAPGLYEVTYSYDGTRTRIRMVEVVDSTPPDINLNGNSALRLDVNEAYTDTGATALDNGETTPVISGIDFEFGQLLHKGYHDGDADALMAFDVPETSLLTKDSTGEAIFTNGPRNQGITFMDHDDTLNSGVGITNTENYQQTWTGVFIARGSGTYEFGTQYYRNKIAIWVDRDQDGVWERDGDNGDERIRFNQKGFRKIHLDSGVYDIAFIQIFQRNAASRFEFVFTTPEGPNQLIRQPVHPAADNQKYMWATRREGGLNTDTAGTISLDYTANDEYGNIAKVSRTIIISSDASNPVLALNGDSSIEHELGEVFNDPGASVLDASGNVIQDDLSGTGVVDVNVLGEYTRTYEFSNAASITRTVSVIDEQAPEITLNVHTPSGETTDIILTSGDTWEDPGVTIEDADSLTWYADTSLYIPNSLNYYGFMEDSANNTMMDFSTDNHILTRIPAGHKLLRKRLSFGASQIKEGVGITRDDYYQDAFTGFFYAAVEGDYEFGLTDSDDYGSFWVDLDQNGIFEHTGDKGDEQMVADKGSRSVPLQPGFYEVRLGHYDNQWNARFEATFKTPIGAGPSDQLTVINPAAANQAGLWFARGSGQFDPLQPGVYTIEYVAFDSSGNSSSIKRIVTIESNPVAPVLELAGEAIQHHELGTTWEDPGVEAFTAAIVPIPDPDIQIEGTVDGNVSGTYHLVYKFSNDDGAAVPLHRTVEVSDTTPPVITIYGDNPYKTLPNARYMDEGATAVDSVDGEIAIMITSSKPYIGLLPGLIYEEQAGQTSRVINLGTLGVDPIGPGNIWKNKRPPWRDYISFVYSGEIYDADGILSFRENVEHMYLKVNGQVVFNEGENGTVTESGKIDFGKGGWLPVEIRIGNQRGDSGERDGNDFGFGYDPEGRDNYLIAQNSDPNEATLFRTIGKDHRSIDTSSEGTFTLTYTATDSSGNKATVVREIIVHDDPRVPVISLVGDNPLNHEAGHVFNDPGANAADAHSGQLNTELLKSQDSVDIHTIGAYTLTYDFAAQNGKKAPTVFREVNVVDTTAPNIDLIGGSPYYVKVGEVFTDPGAAVTDNLDSNLTAEAEFLSRDQSLIAQWEFDEESGRIAYDLIGELDCTLVGYSNPSDYWLPGKFGNALFFDSNQQMHVKIPDSEKLDLQKFTITAWVKAPDYSFDMYIFEKASKENVVNSQYNVYLEGSSSTFNYKVITEQTQNINHIKNNLTAFFTVNQWHHIAAVYDGSVQYLYVDDALVGINEVNETIYTNPPGPAYIGAHAPGEGYFFHGGIDDVRIYDRAIPENQIKDTMLRGGVDTSKESTEPYLFQYTAMDSHGNRATVQREVHVSLNPPLVNTLNFDSWATTKLPAFNDNDRKPDADPDQDRLPNLLEYALGSDPAHPNFAKILPGPNLSADKLSITFVRIKPLLDQSLTYSVEVNNDLTNTSSWDSSNVTVQEIADQSELPDGKSSEESDYVRMQAVANIPQDAENLFMRIVVEQ